MSSPLQARRAEEKLGLIIGRIGSIRARLNSLAWQRAAFGGLGWTIAIGALLLLAAFYLRPLAFLAVALVLGLVLAAALMRTARAVWRMHVNSETAAQVADRRAELKGRLETIVQLGQLRKVVKLEKPSEPPLLWPYLIEDTLTRQDEFAPARIEKRRVSRSIYGFLGSLAIAILVFPLIARLHGKPLPASADQMDMTLDLNDLHLRPADPDSDNGVTVNADPATMRRLQEKMAAEGAGSGNNPSNSLGKFVDHARDLAGNLQDKLTGRKPSHPRINLKLTDASDELNALERRNHPNLNPSRKDEAGGAHFEHDNSNNRNDPVLTKPGTVAHNPDEDRGEHGQSTAENGPDDSQNSSADRDDSRRASEQAGNDQGSIGGSGHGIGADPDTLFGPPADAKLGSQGFEISIDARQVSHGSAAAGHTYLPPKVRTPLNGSQHPDEPIARASVPEEDRAAVKRVFER